ncbi:MAG TPA: 23S rRNA (adenine(2503)-C(2))-methyltransferase RlmN [Flavobacteriales bacterium]|jgi:23S rRNA (adenine2503-C2)-methyltransferase|nr:23S rRNA (adenine(2503)-C(2))-methyltransferase RlmN [Flavobacteriales bacterium]
MVMTRGKENLRLLDKESLISWLEQKGYPKFRASQIFNWVWSQAVFDFDQMINLPKNLRAKLKEEFDIPAVVMADRQKSTDGTEKYGFRLHSGEWVEGVLIPADDRYTACISSQAGCSLNCAFCATGKLGLKRNLKAFEIYDQARLVNEASQESFGRPLTNIVYMGMGEPLLNYTEVVKSIDLITKTLEFSPRRITVSTAGIAKAIHRLADNEVRFNLALSLHAPDDKKRSEIMAINETNSIDILMNALKAFSKKAKGKITFEYVMLRGFNDTLQDAEKLVKLASNFPVKVNLIEYNPIDQAQYKKAEKDTTFKFAEHLKNKGVMANIRRSRGEDIDAACGQLANKRS